MESTNLSIYISYTVIFFIVALASRQIGKYFSEIKLPLITGFLFVGILAGPFILNMVPAVAVSELKFIDEISLAFIAFSAGSELVVRQIKSRLKAIRYVTIGLVTSTFCVSSFGFYVLSEIIPVIKSMSAAHRAAASLLVGAIMTARSPSSAIAIVNELRAKGPFTKTALGVTMIMDVVVIILFSISGSITETVLENVGFDSIFLLIMLAELSLTLLSGYLVSQILRLILSLHCGRWWKTILVMATGFGMFAVANPIWALTEKYMSHGILIEPLLSCMIAGFFYRKLHCLSN